MTKLVVLQGIVMSIGGRYLYEIDDLAIESGDKVGIIGDNGSGKTTLLRLITGELKPEKGLLTVNTTFNYFEQLSEDKLDTSDTINYKFLSEMQVPLVDKEFMSEGEVQKLRLSQCILSQQGPLILDEPTNYLDASSINRLINQLVHYRNTLLIVTQQRELLQKVANKIWSIEEGKVTEYIGNYDDYLDQQAIRRITHQHEHERYVKKRKQIQTAIERKKSHVQRLDNVSTTQKQRKINPGRLAASKDKKSGQKGIERGIRQLKHRLENLEMVEARTEKSPILFPQENFTQLYTKVPIIAHKFHLSKGSKVLINRASFQFSSDEKVAIIGDNGTGKTSLLESIAERTPDIFISAKANISSYEQINRINVHLGMTPLSYLKQYSEYSEEFIIEMLENLGIKPSSFDMPLDNLSGGEHTRISLAKVFLSPSNILLLDEPTNFLDMRTIEALESLILAYPGLVICASHDLPFVKVWAASVYEIKDKKLVRIK